VSGKSGRVGISEPGEVDFLGRAGNLGHDVPAYVPISSDVQSHAVARDVVQTGDPVARPDAPRPADAPGRPAFAPEGRPSLIPRIAAEEDLLPRRAPQRVEHLTPFSGQVSLVRGAVDDADCAALLVRLRVLDESDQVAFGRDPQERHVTRTLVKRLPDRILDA